MDEETPTSEEEGKGDFMDDLVKLNAKTGYDAYFIELMEGARQNRLQSAQIVAASLDNVRGLQSASIDHVRGMNVLNQMTLQGTKIAQEEGWTPDADEIAASAMSVATALSSMNSSNRQTDSTTAALSQQLAQMTAQIAQIQASLNPKARE